MKLAEIENAMNTEGFSEELYSQFQDKLKYVRGNYNKCQHCYTTACGFKKQDLRHAIRMIQYGLDNFAESWIDYYRSYGNLADIYARLKDYPKVRSCYLTLLEKMREFREDRYADTLAVKLILAELQCEGFSCTDELRRYRTIAKSDVAKDAFLPSERFWFALSELVVLLHEQDLDGARRVYADAMNLLKGRGGAAVYTTEEALRFLEEAAVKVMA